MDSSAEPLPGTEALPLEPGACYLIKEKKPDISYRVFSMLTPKMPGLVITRQYPDIVRRKWSIPESRVIWLSHTPGPDYHNPTALGALAKLISGFIDEHQGVVMVLLDGVEFLAVNNGFLQTLMFVEHVNEFVMQRKAIVVIPVSPDALEEKELALLERNVEVVESSVLKEHLETREVSRLLDAY